MVTFRSQWLNYTMKPAKTSATMRCQAHKACYWQYHSVSSQIPREVRGPELLKSLSGRIAKNVSNVTKKRCKEWCKPTVRLLTTSGTKKAPPWLRDVLLLCTKTREVWCTESFQTGTYGRDKMVLALPFFSLTQGGGGMCEDGDGRDALPKWSDKYLLSIFSVWVLF